MSENQLNQHEFIQFQENNGGSASKGNFIFIFIKCCSIPWFCLPIKKKLTLNNKHMELITVDIGLFRINQNDEIFVIFLGLY